MTARDFAPARAGELTDLELLPRRFEAFVSEVRTQALVVDVRLGAIARLGAELENTNALLTRAVADIGELARRTEAYHASYERQLVEIAANLRVLLEDLARGREFRAERIEAVADVAETIAADPPPAPAPVIPEPGDSSLWLVFALVTVFLGAAGFLAFSTR